MKINAIAPWFGGKRTLASRIVEALGPHSAYWEPFCGSMAVLMAKPPCRSETVNDLHGDLINLARVVRDRHYGPKLYRMLRRTLIHEGLFSEAESEIHGNTIEVGEADDARQDLDRAYMFFLSIWLGRNGLAGTTDGNCGRSFCVRYTANGGSSSTRFNSAVSSVPAWRKRLRNVTIIRRDAFAILERIDDTESTAIYCDPPYIEKTCEYIYDFASADHQRLATALARFRHARARPLGLDAEDSILEPVPIGIVDQRNLALRIVDKLVVVVPCGHPEDGVRRVACQPLVPLPVVKQPSLPVEERDDMVIG